MESKENPRGGAPLKTFLIGAATGSILTGIGLFMLKGRKHGHPEHSGHGHRKGSGDGGTGCCPD